jgi:hypothetical protein
MWESARLLTLSASTVCFTGTALPFTLSAENIWTKKEEVTKGRRKVHNKLFYNLNLQIILTARIGHDIMGIDELNYLEIG